MSRLRRGERTERGAATAFFLMLVVVLFACAGLVFDGGSALNARMRLADVAEQAARAGADQIDVEALRNSGALEVNTEAARQAASDWMRAAGYPDAQVRIDDDGRVSVTGSATGDTQILGLVGFSTFTVHATATAEEVTQ
ncbi:MAG: TadE/TadG family type IV pilus assembly protein [Nocardioides sp.]|uniref:TadE/TadG family type IV pilus assembly protein n=1 Tax=Nocardioides nematodiphilus TaxID=2849669 RepID=UPI001CD9F804|nr:pilus assembly protein TadG-related protein [Nocardioides nematodiphilus]MCA1983988.1 pilus assembly protein TadG-related protein [Nocardioides nematodiphilus]